MPELYGLARPCDLSIEESAGLECLQRLLGQSRQVVHSCEQQSWGTVGVVTHHANDPSFLARTSNPNVVCAWVGDPFCGHVQADADRLAEAVVRSDGRLLADLGWPFALVVLDACERTLHMVSDPYGLHPVYYSCRDGALVFCTKFLPLLRSGLAKWRLDREAILDFFTYEHVTGDRTFADTIQVLPPATVLCFRNGRATLSSYADPMSIHPVSALSVRQATERLYECLRQSVRQASGQGRRVAITLSGGLDSRAILGCAIEEGVDVRTYTFGQPGCRDIIYGAELARVCGMPHAVMEVNGDFLPDWIDHGVSMTGGMVNCVHYHILTLASLLREGADVVLDGLGGDAWTGAHLKWGMLLSHRAERLVDIVYRMRATVWPTSDLRRAIFQPEFLRGLEYDPREAVRRHFQMLDGMPSWMGCHRFDILERQRRFIQYGPHQLRPMVDVRTPFYCPQVIGLLASLGPGRLMEQALYLRMQRTYLPALAAIGDSARGLPVSCPSPIRFAAKVKEFLIRRTRKALAGKVRSSGSSTTDYPGWFRGTLRSYVTGQLLRRDSPLTDLIQPQAMSQILDEQFAGTADHTCAIGCMLALEAFCRAAGHARTDGRIPRSVVAQ